MSKSVFSIIAGVIIIVGGYFLYNSMNKDNVNNENNSNVTGGDTKANISSTTVEAKSGKKMAFSQFLKNGGNYKCTVRQSFNEVEANGVVYVNDTRVSAEYDANVQGMQVKTNLIVKDDYTYSWSSVMPGTGIKVKVNKPDVPITSTAMSAQYGFNADMIGDYNCEAWTLDESKFTLPKGITFKEIK
jgi:hypothetical protein